MEVVKPFIYLSSFIKFLLTVSFQIVPHLSARTAAQLSVSPVRVDASVPSVTREPTVKLEVCSILFSKFWNLQFSGHFKCLTKSRAVQWSRVLKFAVQDYGLSADLNPIIEGATPILFWLGSTVSVFLDFKTGFTSEFTSTNTMRINWHSLTQKL